MTAAAHSYGERNSRLSRSVGIGAALLTCVSLAGVVYVTIMDGSALVAHWGAARTHIAADETLNRLELEIAAESVKVFLDVYLLIALALLLVSLVRSLRRSPTRDGLGVGEFSAAMFLSQIGMLRSSFIGVVSLRVLVAFVQRSARLESQTGADLLYGAIVICLLACAFLVSRKQRSG